jgi:excisionase family DNA binding protein
MTTDKEGHLALAAPSPEASRDSGANEETLNPQGRAKALGLSASVPAVLTVEELAALLRVNRKTVYDALSRGEIPGARRLGGRYRILRDAVIGWFASSQDCVSRSRRFR